MENLIYSAEPTGCGEDGVKKKALFLSSFSLSLPLSLPLSLRFPRLLDISRARVVVRGAGRGRRKGEKGKRKIGCWLLGWNWLRFWLQEHGRWPDRYVKCQLNGG